MKKAGQHFRDILFIEGDLTNKCFRSYGVSFYEFMTSAVKPPRKILLLQSDFTEGDYHEKLKWDIVNKKTLPKLIADDIYGYGNFCWVDFKKKSTLNQLKKIHIAELLYFNHCGEKLKQPFIPALENNYAYWSHDDGFFNCLYIKKITDYAPMLKRILLKKLSLVTTEKFSEIPISIAKQLVSLTPKGLYIDFKKTTKTQCALNLSILLIGNYPNMDEIYNNHRDKMDGEKVNLVYNEGKWQIDL